MKTLLILTQGYPPDPMSVGQHLADVARAMVVRGHRVVVLTSERGYDDPSVRYPRFENQQGVEVHRLPLSSFGKASISKRLAAAALFLAQCAAAGLRERDLGALLVSTVPPLTGTAALPARFLRRVPLAYWVMDMNPEQLIALGKLQPRSPVALALEATNRALLRSADLVIALDRFMQARLQEKASLGERLLVAPPWPHEDHIAPVAHEDNPWRDRHALGGRFVFMYSGNHSPSNPLRTLLDATLAFKTDSRVDFFFVGGGQGKREVEAHIAQHGLTHVRSLPYEPLEALRYSLSAADVHLVALGEPFVGVIHPCKVYGAMAVSRPVLFLGPAPSHIDDLLSQGRFGWRIAHGDVEGAVRTLREIVATPAEQLRAMGERGREVLQTTVSQRVLVDRVCERLAGIMR